MTQEEKIKEAKRLYEIANADQRYVLESLFPELKEGEDERIRKQLIVLVKSSLAHTDEEINEMIAWLEKQGEKKPADKVEPKFHKGEWVVYCNDDVDLITGIEENGYSINNSGYIPFVCASDVRLWTIQDAKDGDVLVASDGSIFLFAGVVGCACKHYVALTTYGDVKFNEGLKHCWENSSAVYPATKEQYDALKKAIADAGYTFDFEKKELKKIEPTDKYEGLTDFERTLADICIGWIGEELGWKQYIKDNADVLLKIAIEKFNSVQDTPFEQKPVVIIPKFKIGDNIKTANEEPLTITKIDDKGYWSEDLFICGFEDITRWELVEQKPAETVKWSPQEESCICQLESLVKEQWRQADKVHDSVNIKKMSELMFFLKTLNPNKKPQRIISAEAKEAMYDKPAWSEEDKNRINRLIAYFEDKESFTAEDDIVYANFLKSLKERVQPKQE